MATVTIEELQRDAIDLVRRAEAGEAIVVIRDDRPVVELRPAAEVAPRKGKRPFGLAKGQFVVPDDFNAPLPEEILRDFEGQATDEFGLTLGVKEALDAARRAGEKQP